MKPTIEDSFKEIDEKLNILDKDTINWVKGKMLLHISDAYERGKENNKTYKKQ